MSKTLICFGDSLVFSFKIKTPDKWTALLARETGLTVLNRGVCRESTQTMQPRFKEQVLDKKPDLLFLLAGANDIFQLHEITTPVMNLKNMAVEALNRDIPVIMSTIPPFVHPYNPEFWTAEVDFSEALPLREALNKEIRKLQKELSDLYGTKQVLLCDLAAAFEQLSFPELTALYLDELHQNEAGQKKIAGLVKKVL